MIVQIYRQIERKINQKVRDEVKELDRIGVDNIGLAPFPDNLDMEKARKILNSLENANGLALTHSSSVGRVVKVAEKVDPDIFHLAQSREELPISSLAEIRKKYPGLKLMRSVYVESRDDVDLAQRYDDLVDYILLDTKEGDRLGVTGKTHNWEISREITKSVKSPVILAGGLSPDNVEQAIKQVRPEGVDSKTKTDMPDSEEKNPAKVKEFMERAKATRV